MSFNFGQNVRRFGTADKPQNQTDWVCRNESCCCYSVVSLLAVPAAAGGAVEATAGPAEDGALGEPAAGGPGQRGDQPRVLRAVLRHAEGLRVRRCFPPVLRTGLEPEPLTGVCVCVSVSAWSGRGRSLRSVVKEGWRSSRTWSRTCPQLAAARTRSPW